MFQEFQKLDIGDIVKGNDMKIISTMILCVVWIGLQAQECIVIPESINTTYSGDCKKGLAWIMLLFP